MTSKNPNSEPPARATASAPRAGEQDNTATTNHGGPFEPRDGNDKPTVKSWQDIAKILAAVTIWFATSDAAAALREAARYTELGRTIPLFHLTGIPNVVLWGSLLGLCHGFILAIKALVFIWVGPTFFEYLYPVFVAASRISARVANDLRIAWFQTPLPLDSVAAPPEEDDDDTDDPANHTAPQAGPNQSTDQTNESTSKPSQDAAPKGDDSDGSESKTGTPDPDKKG
jgi:hypothetical protein